MDSAHTFTCEEILQRLNVSVKDGLNSEQVERLREKYGLNGKTKLCHVHGCQDCLTNVISKRWDSRNVFAFSVIYQVSK